MTQQPKSVIIIGKGPAGISAALYTARAKIDTTVIANGLGSLEKAEKIENFYGLEAPISGPELVARGVEQAKKLGVKFVDDEVLSIDNSSSLMTVVGKNGSYEASAILIATGASRPAPRIEGLRDLEGKGVSYCAVCDAFFYRGKDVAVLGNGEFALHEAKELLPVVGSVTVLTNGDEAKADFPPEVKVITSKIKQLHGGPFNPLFGTSGPLERVEFENEEELNVSGLFVAYGTAGSVALAMKLGILTQDNSIVVDKEMRTNINGVFAAGDCTGGLLQIAKATGDGAIAAKSMIKYLRD